MTDSPNRKDRKAGSAASTAFFATIAILCIAVLGLVVMALLRGPETAEAPPPVQPDTRELDSGTLQWRIAQAAEAADTAIARQKGEIIDALFGPAYAAIPAYADWHYSVRGEYTELAQVALGASGEKMRDVLYDGFDARLPGAIEEIDALWQSAFLAELDTRLSRDLAPGETLGPETSLAIEGLRTRLSTGLPLMAIGGLAGGAAGVKAAGATIGKIALKTGGKTAGKTVGKLAGVGSGAASGAAVGAALGPAGAAVGGVIGGVVAWFAVDKVVVEIDEALTRDSFEADLRANIDAHRLAFHEAIDTALAEKGAAQTVTLRGLLRENDEAR